jgi:hypothetical protein
LDIFTLVICHKAALNIFSYKIFPFAPPFLILIISVDIAEKLRKQFGFSEIYGRFVAYTYPPFRGGNGFFIEEMGKRFFAITIVVNYNAIRINFGHGVGCRRLILARKGLFSFRDIDFVEITVIIPNFG